MSCSAQVRKGSLIPLALELLDAKWVLRIDPRLSARIVNAYY